MGETNWLPALVALAAGLLGGIFFLFRAPARRDPGVFSASERHDLQARFDELIDRLRGGDLPQHTTLAVEIEAAQLLRELETPQPAAPAVVSSDQHSHGLAKPVKALLWITGLASVGAITYLLLLTSMVERQDGAPITGDQSLVGAAPTASEEALKSRVMANPRDLDARLALARGMLDEGRMIEVWEQTVAVLAQDADNGRAMAYQSLVLLSIGNAEEAEAVARKAVTAEPQLVETWVHLALVHFRQGKVDEALGDLARAKQVSPADAALLDRLAAEMKGGGAAASQKTPRFAGQIQLSAEDAVTYQGATLFVIVRDAASTGGPPIAAARLAVTGERIPFAVHDSDSMTGAPLPQAARLEFRIDTDGDPLTRTDGPSTSVQAASGSLSIAVRLAG